MRKMRLDPESLVVEAFLTTGQIGGRGTVRGHISEQDSGCCPSVNCELHTQLLGCNPIITGYNIHSNTGCVDCICPLLKTGTPGVC